MAIVVRWLCCKYKIFYIHTDEEDEMLREHGTKKKPESSTGIEPMASQALLGFIPVFVPFSHNVIIYSPSYKSTISHYLILSGGSWGGVRAPTLFLGQIVAHMTEKNFFSKGAASFTSGSGWSSPPPLIWGSGSTTDTDTVFDVLTHLTSSKYFSNSSAGDLSRLRKNNHNWHNEQKTKWQTWTNNTPGRFMLQKPG